LDVFDMIKRLMGFGSEAESHARRFAAAWRDIADDAERMRDHVRGVAGPVPANVLPCDTDGNVTLSPVKRGRTK
jgi:hypothetical protein